MTENQQNQWEFEVFYDGKCPICMREINFIRRRDTENRIQFTDFTAETFSTSEIGKSLEQLNARIHGRLPDGTIVMGVEVFRRLYGAIGWKMIVSMTRLPVIRQFLDIAYVVFARNRLRLTGRSLNQCSLASHPKSCSSDSQSAENLS